MQNHLENLSTNEIEDHPDLSVLKPGEVPISVGLGRKTKIPTIIQFTDLPQPNKFPNPDNATKREANRFMEHTRTTCPLIEDDDDPLGNKKLERIAERLRQTNHFSPLIQQPSSPVHSKEAVPLSFFDKSEIIGLILLGLGGGFLIYFLLTKVSDVGSKISAVEQGILPK